LAELKNSVSSWRSNHWDRHLFLKHTIKIEYARSLNVLSWLLSDSEITFAVSVRTHGMAVERHMKRDLAPKTPSVTQDYRPISITKSSLHIIFLVLYW